MDAPPMEGMPISGVTLYDNGYAVFQRECSIQGHGSINLYFTSEHMKSVLESLQFLDDGGKQVGNIAYEATKPKASIDLCIFDPLLSLIRSLVGHQVSILHDTSLEKVEGRILGVDDALTDPTSKSDVEHVTLLLDGGVIRSLPIKSVHSFHILETQVQQDLTFSLDLKRSSNRDDLQRLSVFFNNVEQPQKLVARYGFQVSEWKSSYRMRLTDHPTQFELNGLAIVENTLDEDWNDVSLTLVVGAPPIESSSVSVTDQGMWSLNIKTLDGAYITVRANPKDSVLSVKCKIARNTFSSVGSFKLVFAGKPVEDGRLLSDYTIRNNATLHMMSVTSRSGQRDQSTTQSQFVMAAQDNLSYYPIPMRVTAKRKQKAIVPLLQVNLEGQKVVLYDETIRKGNPLSSVLFENTTGRTLEGGSIQVSTDDVFLGQGSLPTLHPGDESPPIPFAVELGCEVVKSNDSTYLQPHRVTVDDGTLTIVRVHNETTTYHIKNKSDKHLDFLLDHLFLEGYDLVQNLEVEEEEPVDITDHYYQFRFAVPASMEKSFVVLETRNETQEYSLQNVEEEDLQRWCRKKRIDPSTEKAIRKIFTIKKSISAISRGIYEKECEIREVESTQRRLRENIAALGGHEAHAAKYVKSLATEEDKLYHILEQIKKDRQHKKQLEAKLASDISKVKFSKEFPHSTCDDSPSTVD